MDSRHPPPHPQPRGGEQQRKRSCPDSPTWRAALERRLPSLRQFGQNNEEQRNWEERKAKILPQTVKIVLLENYVKFQITYNSYVKSSFRIQ